jgi:hypothetical protein
MKFEIKSVWHATVQIEPGRVRQSEMNTESLAVLIKQVKQEVYKN